MSECHPSCLCDMAQATGTGAFAKYQPSGAPMSVLNERQRETLRKALDAYEAGRLDFEGFVEEVELL